MSAEEWESPALAYNRDTLPFPENRVSRVFARWLTWDELDPARHPFAWDEDEEATLSALIREWVPPVLSGMAGWWEGERWCEYQVEAIIQERYGNWATGWNWCYRYGGVIGSWVTGETSVTTPDATATRAVAALLEWREWLERLAEIFEELAPSPEASPEERSWHLERASVRLVTRVLDSGAEGGWHGMAALTMTWFLVSTGMDPGEAERAVRTAIDGRFESWTYPGNTLIDSVGEDLAVALTGRLPYQDHRERAALEEFHDRAFPGRGLSGRGSHDRRR